MKTIMAIGAHVGDMELTCGGVMAKATCQGNKNIIVSLTAGERGNPPNLTVEQYKAQKVDEAERFAKKVNGESIVLDYEDGLLPNNNEIKFKVAELIRKYQPDTIITHWKNSMHKDHMNTHHIVVDAQYYAAMPDMDIKYDKHFAPVFFAENWEDSEDFVPYLYVNITEGFDIWLEALKEIWFVTNSKSFKYLAYYKHLSFVRGAQARCENAQAFMIPKYPIKKVVDMF